MIKPTTILGYPTLMAYKTVNSFPFSSGNETQMQCCRFAKEKYQDPSFKVIFSMTFTLKV